jgi:hypothetical protein
MGGKMLKKIADFEKVVHRKIVHHDEFCYRLKLMYLFLLHVVYYEGLRMYNKLPREIKNCTIMLKFKQLLRVYMRENF